MSASLLDLIVRQLYGSLNIDRLDGVETTSGGRADGRPFDRHGKVASGQGDEMSSMDTNQRDLDRRFDTVGWGLLFLLFGALAMPNGTGEYAAVAAIGAGMLLLNALRRLADVPIRWFSVILGSALLIAGCGALGGMHMDAFVLFFVLAGVVNIAAAVVRPRPAATA
jgi:hypothetical protein